MAISTAGLQEKGNHKGTSEGALLGLEDWSILQPESMRLGDLLQAQVRDPVWIQPLTLGQLLTIS